MSIRQTLQRHSAVMTGIMLVVIIGALVAIVIHFAYSSSPGAAASQAYFSTDEGLTWFADDIAKVPPFLSGGKEAVQAHVYRCGSDKPFVAYVSRFTPEGKKAVENAYAQAKEHKTTPDNRFMEMMRIRHGEIKRPGDSRWVNEKNDIAACTAIMKVTCPDGNMEDLTRVMP